MDALPLCYVNLFTILSRALRALPQPSGRACPPQGLPPRAGHVLYRNGPGMANNAELRRGDDRLLSPGAFLQAGPTTFDCRTPSSYDGRRPRAVVEAIRVPTRHAIPHRKAGEQPSHFQGVSSTLLFGVRNGMGTGEARVTQQPDGEPHSRGVAEPRLWDRRVPVLTPRPEMLRGRVILNAPAEDYSVLDRAPNAVPRIGLALDRLLHRGGWSRRPSDVCPKTH